MKSKSRIEIVTETTREISLRIARRRSSSVFGEKCAACQSVMLSINEAARRTGIVWDEIVSAVKSGVVHSTETANGEIYVCAGSLIGHKIKG